MVNKSIFGIVNSSSLSLCLPLLRVIVALKPDSSGYLPIVLYNLSYKSTLL